MPRPSARRCICVSAFAPATPRSCALGLLTTLAIYNAVAGRKRDRAEVSDQVSNLARGSGDLARQVAEFGRRLAVVEDKLEGVLDRALTSAQPLAAEIEELSRLVEASRRIRRPT